jgi:hypothetical protein
VLNPDDLLRPEMNANVQFLSDDKPTSQAVTGAVVPMSAVKEVGGKKVVFIVYKEHAKAREIKVVSQRNDGYLVEGLTGGEDVIVRPPADLKDGDRIRLKGNQ